MESPEINYLPCSISTKPSPPAPGFLSFLLLYTLHQVPEHFLENSWSLQRKGYTKRSDLPCVIYPIFRWVRKVTLLNCNLHFKDCTKGLFHLLCWQQLTCQVKWKFFFQLFHKVSDCNVKAITFSWTFVLGASLPCSQEMVYGRCYCCYNCGTEQYVWFEKTHFSIFPIISKKFYPILDLSKQLYSILFLFLRTFNNNQNFTFFGKSLLLAESIFTQPNLKSKYIKTLLNISQFCHVTQCSFKIS